MRWRFPLIGLGVLALLGGEARAELRFVTTRADLGKVRSGANLGYAFKFVNPGPDPVEITEARPSCGCLRPRLRQTLFAPGAEGSIPLEINARGESAGPHTWGLRLLSRAGGQLRETLLEVTADVVTEVTLQPAALTLVADGPLGQDILLTDLRANPLTLREIVTSSPCLRARATGRVRDGLGHWVYTLRLEFSGECPEGRHNEMLALYTDDPDYRELKLPITLTRRPRQRVAATPGRVVLELAPGQTSAVRCVYLADRQGGAVVVEGVSTDDPALACEPASGSGRAAAVKIRVERGRLRGDSLDSAVHVRLSSPVRETVVIPVTCLAEPDAP